MAPKSSALDRFRKPLPDDATTKSVPVSTEARRVLVPEHERREVEITDNQLFERLTELAQTEAGLLLLRTVAMKGACESSLSAFCQEAWHTVEGSNPLVWGWQHELICTVLAAMFFDWRKSKRSPILKKHINAVRNLAMNLCPGSLKPVSTQSLVTTARGLIKAGDVRVGDLVITHQGRLRPVLALSEKRMLPTLLLETFHGRQLRCAYDHPVLTQHGWTNAGDIIVGDVVAAVHQTETTGNKGSLQESRLLGYLIGDGSIREKTATFTNQDPQTIADFIACAQSLGMDGEARTFINAAGNTTFVVNLRELKTETCVRKDGRVRYNGRFCHECHKERERCYRANIKFVVPSETVVADWLTKHDLNGKRSSTKRVPRFVMEGDEDVIAEYLAAYWACDGGIQDRRDVLRKGRNNQKTNSVRLDATTVSEGLARDHLALLQRLGLSFHLRRQVSKLTNAMVGKSLRSLARIGSEYISWGLKATTQDTVAKFMQLVAPRMRHEKSNRAQGTKRTEFDVVLNADEIVSITRAEDTECVCFQVEEDSSFVCDGVAVHNSRLTSVFFPAWCWANDPTMKFICLSVNEDAALRDARAMRDVIRSEWYQTTFSPSWELKSDQDAISNFGNTKGGERLSRASGSEIVGLRADCLIIDDPNNPLDAMVKNERDKVNTLWATNQFNRVNDMLSSLRIGVQQKTHVEDWTNFVTTRDGLWSPENLSGWLHMVIPAEFDPKRKFVIPPALLQALPAGLPYLSEDPRSVEGESVDPIRMPISFLKDLKKQNEGTNFYATQYLQQPTSIAGDMVQRKWFSFFSFDPGVRPTIDEDPLGHERPFGCHAGKPEIIHARQFSPNLYDFDEIALSLDCAAKETTKGSQWGIGVLARRGGRRYLLEDKTQRGSIITIVEVVRGLIRKWEPSIALIEDKAGGIDLRIRLLTEMNKGDMPAIQLEAIKVPTGKIERMNSCLPVIANGMFALRDGAPWLEHVVSEVSGFPNAANDDIPDYISMALNYWALTEADAGYRLVGF